jgi:hypothetical protein
MTTKKPVLFRATQIMAEDMMRINQEGSGCLSCIALGECINKPTFNCSGVIRAAYIKKAEGEVNNA